MLKKVSFEEAVKMEIDGMGHLLHLKWMPDLAGKNPDCSHVVIHDNRRWHTRKHQIALVLRDDDAEENYEHKKAQEALKRESLSSKDATGS